MKAEWTEKRVLIWGKTYPELSTKYYETVCTGGCLEDGTFIRLYPIPLRYLSDEKTFVKYQWVQAKLRKSAGDPRPESYEVDPQSITPGAMVKPDRHVWRQRKALILKNASYQYDSVEDLLVANRKNATSMGFIRPKSIEKITIDSRPPEEYEEFLRKLEANRQRSKQGNLFSNITIAELKKLQYISKRFKIHWHCYGTNCHGHAMSILDWEAYELVRRTDIATAQKRIEEILNTEKYEIGFFLGNFKLHPTAFAIGGIWYPKKPKDFGTYDLFETKK